MAHDCFRERRRHGHPSLIEGNSDEEDRNMGKKQKQLIVSRRDFLKKGAALGASASALAGLAPEEVKASQIRFDRVADVVVIGAGASGLAASIRAADSGASVVAVESNFDIGGHGMLSGGNLSLGGGTTLQKKYNIQDSADEIFLQYTSPSPDHAFARYNDREIVRAFADNNAATFEFLVANGVKFPDKAPQPFEVPLYPDDNRPATVPRHDLADVITIPRWQRPLMFPAGLEVTIMGRDGAGIVRPLEASARKKGVEFLLLHKMTSIIRESPTSGRVLGITATYQGKTLNIQAKKAVIIATGGSTGNVEFRRMFDPRLTEEYQQAGDAYTLQNAEGEYAALEIGASIWGTANQTNEKGLAIAKAVYIGCRVGYNHLQWSPKSPVFKRAGASGLTVKDWQNAILVNMVGLRFWNELDASYDFLAACLGSVVLDGGKARVGGPIWAIFDSDAVKRENWTPTPPNVDLNGYFFSGETLPELANKVVNNPYQKRPMPASALEETVARYNSFVEVGKDADFEKPAPKYKIQTPPFYAAWSTPILHDTLAGLRVNAKYQVLDRHAQVIPGLYCVGESAGGFGMHGLARSLVGGYIAGGEAALKV
jgi:urocanate reductase